MVDAALVPELLAMVGDDDHQRVCQRRVVAAERREEAADLLVERGEQGVVDGGEMPAVVGPEVAGVEAAPGPTLAVERGLAARPEAAAPVVPGHREPGLSRWQ